MSSRHDTEVTSTIIPDDGRFPGNPTLPLVRYRAAFPIMTVEAIEAHFLANGWGGTWRNGIFPYHHYHSTAHEVLGMAAGWARVQFGGRGGPEFRLEAGDAVVIPAGVAHKNLEHSDDYLVVGAYPAGEIWDIHTGIEGERPKADEHIRAAALPTTDPIEGAAGALIELWRLERGA